MKNRNLIKALACLLALALLWCPLLSVSALAQDAQDGRKLPTIHVKGKVAAIYKNYGTDEQVQVFDNWTGRVPVPDGYIEEQVKALLPKFLFGVMTGVYEPWAKEFSHVLEPIYRDIALDKNGDPQYGTAIPWSYDPENLPDRADGEGNYATDAYEFEYDWRLSPLRAAEQLKDYVEAVLRATGKTQYNLVARCEGACVAAAFLSKYADARLRSVVYMAPCSNGCTEISCLFGGDVNVTPEAVNRYMALNLGTDAEDGIGGDLFDGEDFVWTFLRDTVSMLALTHGLDLPAKTVVRIYNKIKNKVYPGLLMSSFGTFPGYWAMVDDAHYETAKKLCGLTGDPEYAAFVAQLDEYHYQVQNRQVDVLNAYKANGGSFSLLVKYGTEILPFIGDANMINDSTLTVYEASFGATTAPQGGTLPAAYAEQARSEGRGRYLSPDLQIDAFTGAFPDDTYYAKFCPHGEWYGEVYWWLNYAIERGADMNADTNDRYPRFLFWDREAGTLSPLTVENAGRYEGYYKTDALTAVRDFFRSFFTLVRFLMQRLFQQNAAA